MADRQAAPSTSAVAAMSLFGTKDGAAATPGFDPAGDTELERVTKVMEAAANTPQAAVRFLNAIGFEEFGPASARLKVTLSMMLTMSMLDLERKLGVVPKKAVVALYDECRKLRQCFDRSSFAVDVPLWLPVVLRLPPSALEAPSEQRKPRPPPRPASARGASAGAHQPSSAVVRPPLRRLTASERVRFMLSGLQPPEMRSPMVRQEARQQKSLAAQQLHALHQEQGRVPAGEPLPPSRAPSPPTPGGGAHGAVVRAPRRLPDPEAAAAADAARAAVLQHVSEREATLAAMRALLPPPRGVVARRRATRELILNQAGLAQVRMELAQLLGAMRRSSAAILRAIYEWKLTLRAKYTYFASLGERVRGRAARSAQTGTARLWGRPFGAGGVACSSSPSLPLPPPPAIPLPPPPSIPLPPPPSRCLRHDPSLPRLPSRSPTLSLARRSPG